MMIVALLVGACASKGSSPAVDNVVAEHEEVIDTPTEVLGALAEAAAREDGALLDTLVHPEHGLWVWVQPGAYVVPAQLLRPDGKAPSARLDADVINEYWREALWKSVAGSLERGLKVMDRDPADRNDPIYGDCGADDGMGGAQRTWLATDDLGELYDQILDEAQVTVPPVMARGLVHFHSWGLDVWMARDRDRWWVAHVMVWTPCDA